MSHALPSRSRFAGILLLLGLTGSLGMVSVSRLVPEPLADAPIAGTAEEWALTAEKLQHEGKHAMAIEACRAGLVVDPWNPGLCRTLTRLYLTGEDDEALKLWMDDLVMGDARQAEQLFNLPGFSERMDDPELLHIRREARLQARD